MKVLTVDIETSPMVVMSFGLFDQNISIKQILQPTRMLCWAAKWHGEKKVEFRSEHHDGTDVMLERIHALLDEADAVVGYNSKSFDIKHIFREFLQAGMSEPSPFADIDLIKTARGRFRFNSNKLDWVSRELGIGSKVENAGIDLWRGVMIDNDPKRWGEMKRYCKHDVVLTEQLYDRLRPWIKSHPHHGLYDDAARTTCPNCGGHDLQRRGHARTATARYQRFQCQGCGKWCRGKHADMSMGMRGAA
jgi:predicted RNA-binding Zn-ribbon protein involved in translation (DUF1610 family)